MDEIKFEANPLRLPTFDKDLFRGLLGMKAEACRKHGPRVTKITLATATQPVFDATFPKAAATPAPHIAMMGIPVCIDDDVPLGALRLHKADGSEQDIWLLRPIEPEEIVIDETPFMPPNPPGSWVRDYLRAGWWGGWA